MSYDPYLPTINYPEGVSINVTPEQLAEGFWSLDSGQMADFFAALERVASWRLCFQMAHVVGEIADRAGAPNYDHDAQHGFQTMLAHAQQYHDGAAQHRAGQASLFLHGMALKAKRAVA
jgi:hypothetical protein